MLAFINFKEAPEQLEIEVDNDGINDLIQYLQFVEKSRDHIHLTIDTELSKSQIPEERQSFVSIVKAVTIRFIKAN
jgi:hypothetical protein